MTMCKPVIIKLTMQHELLYNSPQDMFALPSFRSKPLNNLCQAGSRVLEHYEEVASVRPAYICPIVIHLQMQTNKMEEVAWKIAHMKIMENCNDLRAE